jgi:hypothetical protein
LSFLGKISNILGKNFRIIGKKRACLGKATLKAAAPASLVRAKNDAAMLQPNHQKTSFN